MLTVVSCTNREKSNTEIIARKVFDIAQKFSDDDIKFLNLYDLNTTFNYDKRMYHTDFQSEIIRKLQDEYIISATHFAYIIPEYNGSFPGILKTFIDACSVRSYVSSYYHKKALLIGVASGRAGNIRGLDHFSDILQFLNVIIYPQKIPFSSINKYISDRKKIDDDIVDLLENYIQKFLNF